MCALNKEALDQFVLQPVTQPMISYLANAAFQVIECSQSEPMNMPSSVRQIDGPLPSLEDFIKQLVAKSQVRVPTLMSTLVYLNRLKARLPTSSKGLQSTTHRIFLTSLILSAKYLNDSSYKNNYWATCSVLKNPVYNFGFSGPEVNLMEKQLLSLLNWELRITESDLYRELEWFLFPIRLDIKKRNSRQVIVESQ